MRKLASSLVLTAVLLGAASPGAAAVRDLNTVKEGDAIPAFTGRDLEGKEVDVGALIGRKVIVLSFWSIYCKPCVEEISSLIRLTEQLGGDNLEVIGVNADADLGVARIRTFMSRYEEFEKKRITYRNIFDEDNRISKLLGVGFLPTVLSVNLKGQVERIFTGFEEKSESEIFAGIRSLLPLEGGGGPEPGAEETVFGVEAVVPLCGFYDPAGWKGSFQQNYDLGKEIDRIAEVARRKATKMALRQALLALGVSLLQSGVDDQCFLPHGVYLADDPFLVRDPLTNLLRGLTAERLARTVESQEDFLGTEYHVSARVSVDLAALRSQLEGLRFQLTPRTVTFSVVNLRKMDLARFERALQEQSRYVGFAGFPTYTVYTSTESFAEEVKRMDFGGTKLFVEEAAEDRIELEAWR